MFAVPRGATSTSCAPSADDRFESRTDVASVLWQNGLLGYVDGRGGPTYFSIGDAEDFRLPSDVSEYVFHPCVVASSGIHPGRSPR